MEQPCIKCHRVVDEVEWCDYANKNKWKESLFLELHYCPDCFEKLYDDFLTVISENEEACDLGYCDDCELRCGGMREP